MKKTTTGAVVPRRQASLAILLLAGTFLVSPAGAGDDKDKEKDKAAKAAAKAGEENFTARYLVTEGMGRASVGTGASGILHITVERWSTPEEQAALVAAFKEGEQDGLVKALSKMDKGYIHGVRTLRWRLNHAIRMKTEKGLRVRVVTERPIYLVEAATGSISRDYPLGVIEFTLDDKGKGEGTLIPAAKLQVNEDGQVEVVTYNMGPQRLTQVKRTK